jgi:hypothetical protein
MTKKSKSRKERNRLKKHTAIERNRAEIKRATIAREAFIAQQATDHFKHLKETDPNFAAICEQMDSVTLETNITAAELDTGTTVYIDEWNKLSPRPSDEFLRKVGAGEFVEPLDVSVGGRCDVDADGKITNFEAKCTSIIDTGKFIGPVKRDP